MFKPQSLYKVKKKAEILSGFSFFYVIATALIG
jgi:hypothetical protein